MQSYVRKGLQFLLLILVAWFNHAGLQKLKDVLMPVGLFFCKAFGVSFIVFHF